MVCKTAFAVEGEESSTIHENDCPRRRTVNAEFTICILKLIVNPFKLALLFSCFMMYNTRAAYTKD